MLTKAQNRTLTLDHQDTADPSPMCMSLCLLYPLQPALHPALTHMWLSLPREATDIERQAPWANKKKSDEDVF